MQRIAWAIIFRGDQNGAKLGRISIREPRLEDRLDMIADLARIQQFTFDQKLIDSMKIAARRLNRSRDLVAHGLWSQLPDGLWVVQQLRGNWSSEPIPDIPKGSRRVVPEAIPIIGDDLKKINSEIDSLITDARKLADTSIDALPSLDTR